jgi:hypothetical protein
MRKSLLSVVAGAALLFAACGSDSGGASGVQADAADVAIEAGEKEGIEIDEECAKDIASEYSDEDAAQVVEAGTDGSADLTSEGEAISTRLLGCAESDALIDKFIESMKEAGQPFDEQCFRDSVKDVDFADLVASGDRGAEPPAEVTEAITNCFELEVGS